MRFATPVRSCNFVAWKLIGTHNDIMLRESIHRALGFQVAEE
eukprot:CAMPEP_0179015034 /NCGR_PEP_ID=MMETSP0796-20121207/2575_1 /TAXON_ID=73915 /ORGANISM="Pyrodinium bahamense, Strain pbaha01" /LENGTH=41 /DNA_ID= /DNA_START= /DNA_END= /DNA_ORIENTATION=